MFKNLKHSLKISNLKFQIKHHEANIWLLMTVSFIFFLLRLPSLFEPYWYGDEGIYQVIGYALTHGRLLYSGIWDNKPPLLYLIYAMVNGDQTGAKFLSLLAGLGATWAIFFLSKKLFVKFLPPAITTVVFAFLFAIPLIEGNIANAENFMLLPGVVAGLFVYKVVEQKTPKKILFNFSLFTFYLATAGLLLGLSFLIKVVAMFDFAAFAAFLFLMDLDNFSPKQIIASIQKVLPLLVGFLTPNFLCVLFFIFTGTFSTFIHATLFSNVSYVNYGNQFIIPQGFLILKTLLIGVAVLFFLFFRKKISKEVIFIFLWVVFSLYSSLFSGRPYTHYALIMLPSVALLVGLFVTKKNLRIITSISIIVLLIFVSKSFTFYSHSFSYYTNFLSYVTEKESETTYQSFFDTIVPRDYALAQFINGSGKKNEGLLIWGNSGQIYRLTDTLPIGRFIVAYHITMTPQNLAETRQAFTQHSPRFIILLPNQDTIPFSLANYQERLIIQNAVIYEHTL